MGREGVQLIAERMRAREDIRGHIEKRREVGC